MTINEIVKRINKALAGEQLVYSRLEPFMDEVIDDINEKLNAKYPSFSSLRAIDAFSGETDYNYFPEHYIRKVLIKGTAYKFYIMDEEGMQTADMYGYDYQNALFTMMRDYIEKVPEEYRADYSGGLMVDENYSQSMLPFDFKIW